MVELLVVIVIFLIGILAIVQLFPGGFNVLKTTRNNTIATQLIRKEIERLKGRPDQFPDMILPVDFVYGSGTVNLVANPDLNPNSIGPAGARIEPDGDVLNQGGDNLGPWQYVSGSNLIRRVVGEGGKVPAPRAVGNLFGGLMVLQFAPIIYNSDPLYQGLLVVYGNDLVRRLGDPNAFGRSRSWEYFIDNPETSGAEIYLSRDTTRVRQYLLTMTAWVDNGTSVERRDILDIPITVNPDVSGGYAVFQLSSFVAGNFVGAEFDSIRCNRQYREVNAFSDDPFEYVLLDDVLGLILINPVAHEVKVRGSNGQRVPLVAKANYDVYDWRILRDDFRVPDGVPPRQKLTLGNLAHLNAYGPDGKPWPGLNLFTPPGNTNQRDFVLIDLDTGGLYERQDYQVDTSIGVVTCLDRDAVQANGVQMGLLLPGTNTPVLVNAVGRNVRFLYSAMNEWSVQVLKPASRFRTAYARPGIGQFYAGGSGAYFGTPGVPGESATRIYFPPMDDGKKVTVGEIWYGDPGFEPQLLADQEFLIRSIPADPTGLPYIDLADKVSGTVPPLNYQRYGYAVRNVKGASVTVRALWNPNSFKLQQDLDENLRVFERWQHGFRRVESTSFLVKEAE